MSICDIESYRFKSYYLPIKIKNIFKYKKLKNLKINLSCVFITKSLITYNFGVFSKNKKLNPLYIGFENLNCPQLNYYLFYKNKITSFSGFTKFSSWSIGMVLTILNYTKSKFMRRSGKGYKILINFLKVPKLDNRIIFLFKNINNRFFFLKKKIFKKFFFYKIYYFLINLGFAFCKIYGKKIKAIKKRLKKKLILNFISSVYL